MKNKILYWTAQVLAVVALGCGVWGLSGVVWWVVQGGWNGVEAAARGGVGFVLAGIAALMVDDSIDR